jgi:general stress protein 26
MNDTSIKQTCLDLITDTFICQLTTIDSAGYPHTSAMLNLRYAKEYPTLVSLYEEEDNDFVLYMSTSMQSPKMARIRGNPKACVYFCDTKQLVGLMLGGEIEIITDQKLKNRIWQKGWTMYYPNGPDDPTYGIIKLVPSIVKGWCKGPFEIEM